MYNTCTGTGTWRLRTGTWTTGTGTCLLSTWYKTGCNRSQKRFPMFKNALQLIWSALPEKAIDNSVNDFRKWLQACQQTVYILNI